MSTSGPPPEDELRTPISFKLMVGLAALYLGWRLVQGVAWLYQLVFSQ